MPNWCCNTVEFYADKAVTGKIEMLINGLAKKEKETAHGQLPDFVKAEKGWMFEIAFEEGVLYYQTRWSPNHEIIKQIADHFKCGFFYNYDEPGCCIYGELRYEDGVLKERCLDSEDYNLFELMEENDTYVF